MKVAISLLIVVLVLFGGWELWLYWDKFNHDRDLAEQEAAAKRNISPESLQGMPSNLEQSWQAAQKGGAAGMRAWLRRYGPAVGDPRKAWIELDYMVAIAHDDPAEAKKIFADVKSRTPENSPIYPRIKDLQKTYE